MTTDKFHNTPPVIWVLADGRAGNRSQCLGVADQLGLAYQVKELNYGPLAALPNGLLGASLAGLTAESRAGLSPPWPDLVIAAGRRTAPVARKIGRLGGDGCFLAQIMHPGAGAGDFGLIAQPRHDRGAPTRTGATGPLTKGPFRPLPDRASLAVLADMRAGRE